MKTCLVPGHFSYNKNMTDALSKSRYISAVQCVKMLWLKDHKPEVFDDAYLNQAVFDAGNEVGDLAMGLFGAYTEVPYGDLDEMVRLTEQLIRKKTAVICEASFAHDGLFCSVDILKNKGGKHVELYEVKSSSHIHDIYLDDIAFQVCVLQQCGYRVDQACLVYIDSTYERIGELDLSRLFRIADLSDLVFAKQAEVEANIETFRTVLRGRKEPECDLGTYCFSPYACGFFPYCSRHLERPNVFDLAAVQLRTKLQYYRKGLITFQDLYEADCLPSGAKLQVEMELTDQSEHIEAEKIAEYLQNITYPLYYLDFESFQPPVPIYDHSFPFEQIPFQYSLHYQKRKNGRLYHKELLAYPYADPRRAIAEQLCADIPADVCVLAYNMSFEKSRISRLAELFPDLREHLLMIRSHIVDLITPFQKKWFYRKAMHGSYSIKAVLPALFPDDPELDYRHLAEIHNGAEASAMFQKMRLMDQDTMEESRSYLLKYCELDTYAMVKILQKLQETGKGAKRK